MWQWALVVALGMVAGAAITLLMRRERAMDAWLRDEVTGLRDDMDQARMDIRSMSNYHAGTMLDTVEGEDFEIATNLDRMNHLLDQLNGLLKGRSSESGERRKVAFREEPIVSDSVLDFTSPEELARFGSLPPLSREEIQSMDWDYLFNRIQGDDLT